MEPISVEEAGTSPYILPHCNEQGAEQMIANLATKILHDLPPDLSSKEDVYAVIVSHLKEMQNKDEVITIDPTKNSPTNDTSEPKNLQKAKEKITVKELLQNNSHASALPSYALKDLTDEISEKDIQKHTLAQGLLYLGVPASTLPMLANDPKNFGIGFGIGAACGTLIAVISTAKRNHKDDAWKWLQRSAAVTNIYKGIMGSLQAGGISGNIVATLTNSNNELLAIFEGAIAGVISGYEGVDLLLNTLQKYTESQSEPKTAEENKPAQPLTDGL